MQRIENTPDIVPRGVAAGTDSRQGARIESHGADHPCRLALRPKEAARALGIGERLLWSKTNAGEIPHVRVGKAVLYPVASLEKWLLDEAKMVRR